MAEVFNDFSDPNKWVCKCKGCGESLEIGLPCPSKILTVATDKFCKIHEKCKEEK